LGKERCSTQRNRCQYHTEGSQEECGSASASGIELPWSGLAGKAGHLIVENFLEFVIQHLVDAPDEVLVTKLEQGKKLIFKVEMRRSDVGKVIGRNGHTITAMRNLLTAAAARTGHQAILQIVE
jgi:predicted RNA-binding protein YlqC (UPF0109 family)